MTRQQAMPNGEPETEQGDNPAVSAGPTQPNGPILLADLSSPEFAVAAKQFDMVMIPVGAHEQHGPALPVSTDTLSAQVLSALVGALMRPQVAVAPTVPWGVSWQHLGMPGTISLREQTLVSIIVDIVVSLHGYGIERFLIVNTHGGNNAALQIAVEQCHRDHGVPIVASIYAYSMIANAASESLGPNAIGHGGGDESSVVLATRPELVDRGQLGPRHLNDAVRRVQTIVRAGGGVLPLAQHKSSSSGASGDSSDATPEAGSSILGRAAGQLRAVAEELIDLDIEPFRS